MKIPFFPENESLVEKKWHKRVKAVSIIWSVLIISLGAIYLLALPRLSAYDLLTAPLFLLIFLLIPHFLYWLVLKSIDWKNKRIHDQAETALNFILPKFPRAIIVVAILYTFFRIISFINPAIFYVLDAIYIIHSDEVSDSNEDSTQSEYVFSHYDSAAEFLVDSFGDDWQWDRIKIKNINLELPVTSIPAPLGSLNVDEIAAKEKLEPSSFFHIVDGQSYNENSYIENYLTGNVRAVPYASGYIISPWKNTERARLADEYFLKEGHGHILGFMAGFLTIDEIALNDDIRLTEYIKSLESKNGECKAEGSNYSLEKIKDSIYLYTPSSCCDGPDGHCRYNLPVYYVVTDNNKVFLFHTGMEPLPEEVLFRIMGSVRYHNCEEYSKTKIEVDENYINGKSFVNSAMSGEWGKFNLDGTLPTSWGLDYAGPDDRPSSGVGSWQIDDDKLIIKDSSISDGEFTGFTMYEKNGNQFLISSETVSGLIVGPDNDSIENFFDDYVKACLINQF